MANTVFTDTLSVPLNGATTAKVEFDTRSGNLTIDRLRSGERVLARGTLEYLEQQGLPARTLHASNGQATLTLRGSDSDRPRFRFPWQACSAATAWHIHLNPTVASDITAHSGGGNVKLDLAGLAVTHVAADTGGGNMEVILPVNAANLSVTAKTGGGNVAIDVGSGITGRSIVTATSGAGNVVVRGPRDIAARIHASSGWGKVIVDPRFRQVDGTTYQSPDYDGAVNTIEITVNSGAGNVSVSAT